MSESQSSVTTLQYVDDIPPFMKRFARRPFQKQSDLAYFQDYS